MSHEAAQRRLRAKQTAEKVGGVQSLRRALSILRVIAASADGVTLTEIARVTGLASSTVHRLLTTLQQDRFIQFKNDGARWMVGVGAFTVGSAFLSVRDIARGARPLLRRLMEQSGETANLAILSDDMAVYLEQVECLQTVRAICKPGGRVVLHSTSLGKCMLAAMRPEEVNRILTTKGMPRFTPRTIDRPASMALHLSEVRAAGYAVDDEEHSVGLRCVAAAVLDEHGEPIGAISVSGPALKVTHERVPQLGMHGAGDRRRTHRRTRRQQPSPRRRRISATRRAAAVRGPGRGFWACRTRPSARGRRTAVDFHATKE